MNKHFARGCSLLLVLGGCGGGGTTGDASTSSVDPALVGTWFEQVTTDAEDQTETITFGATGAITAVHTQVNQSTSDHAGCTDTVTEMGTFTTSADHTTMMVMAGTTTEDYSGCTSASDNGNVTYTGTGIVLNQIGAIPYSISGTMLTIGTGSATVLTRR